MKFNRKKEIESDEDMVDVLELEIKNIHNPKWKKKQNDD